MSKIFLLLLYLSLFIGCSKPQALTHRLDLSSNRSHTFYDLTSASYINRQKMLDKLSKYRVIFIGDHHDQDELHRKIAELIEDLHKRNKRVRLAAEWFSPSDNDLLFQFISKGLEKEKFLEQVNWKRRVGYKYETFEPIFNAIKKIKGRVVGINLTKKEQENISKRDLIKMSEKEKFFYQNLDLNLSIHQQLVDPYFDHCHSYSKSKEDCAKRMYRVQVAWDSKMALEVFKQTESIRKDEVLVVLAGAMHFYKELGINLRFARLSDEPFLTLLPVAKKSDKIDLGTADAVILYQQSKQVKTP